jgi:hypothetical protein
MERMTHRRHFSLRFSLLLGAEPVYLGLKPGLHHGS